MAEKLDTTQTPKLNPAKNVNPPRIPTKQSRGDARTVPAGGGKQK